MRHPPDSILGFLALAAYFGLPLLIFVFQLGKLRAFWALLWAVFLCLVLGEFLGATFGGLLEEDFRRHPASLQTKYLFLCFFVLLAYGLIGLRIYWLVRCARHRRAFRGWFDEFGVRVHVSIRRWRRRKPSVLVSEIKSCTTRRLTRSFVVPNCHPELVEGSPSLAG
jgi:hypothetical protein